MPSPSAYLLPTGAFNKSEIMRRALHRARAPTLSQAEIDRTAFWIANAALAVAFLVLIFIPS